MGWGLRCKECHNDILHPGLRLLHDMVYKNLIRLQSFLGKLRMRCEGKFFYLQFGSKDNRLRHAHIIMHSRIWFKLSDQGANPSHVTRKVAQNTRPSFSHMWKGLGTTLILGVNLTDTWYRFALRLQVCIQACPPHTASCQAFHLCNAWVYMYLTQFLDYSLSSWWWNNHSCTPMYTNILHTQLLPPPILLHSSHWLLRRPTMEHKSLHALELALCLCWSKSWSAWLSKAIQCPNTPWARGGYRDWNDCRSLRKWQTA